MAGAIHSLELLKTKRECVYMSVYVCVCVLNAELIHIPK